MSKSKKEVVDEKEKLFQKAYDENDWDTMWACIIDCCKNIILSKCYGIVVRDVDEKALDSAIKVVTKIKTGVRPEKLSSFCYLYVIGTIYNKKEIIWDRSTDFSDFQNYYYTEDNGEYCVGDY